MNTLIIGVDGGEPAIFEALARDGEAPSFSALRERGLTGRTCNPKGFEAGAVWPAFHTGLNPGRQPQYDGLRFFDPVTYTNRWFESHEIAPQIWRRASDQGKRVLVIDAPYARLDTEIDGAMIVDWGGHVPSDGQSFRFQTHPAALRSEVLEVVGPDPAGGVLCDRRKLESTGDYREFVRNYLDRIERKAQLAAHMFRKGPWDYAEVVFTELHCVGHHTWHVNDPTHPKYSRQLEVSLGRPLRDAYRAFDRALGRIVGAIDERTNLVLFVSHGMGPQYSGTGLLDRMLAGLESDGGSPRWREPRRPIKARLLTLWHAVPGELRAKLKPLRKPFAGALGVKQFLPNPQGRRFFEVYANNAVGGVRLNLAGRERAGCVSPDDYWKVLDALSEELRDFTNADSGDRLVEECIPTRKLYDGPFSGHLPDLLVVWNRSAPIREVVSPRTGRLRQDYAGARTGDHTPHGMFILAGPQVQPKVLDVDVAPVDFLPTVAALLGIEPGPTQGKSIDGIGR